MTIESDCEPAFVISSSGHRAFDCSHCIVMPIARIRPSIEDEDIRFLLDTLGKRKRHINPGPRRCNSSRHCEYNLIEGLGNTGEVEVSKARAD